MDADIIEGMKRGLKFLASYSRFSDMHKPVELAEQYIEELEQQVTFHTEVKAAFKETADSLMAENAELRQRAERAEAVVVAAREMRSVGVVKCMCADPSRLEACGAAEKKFKAALAASEGGG